MKIIYAQGVDTECKAQLIVQALRIQGKFCDKFVVDRNFEVFAQDMDSQRMQQLTVQNFVKNNRNLVQNFKKFRTKFQNFDFILQSFKILEN